jgi:endoglucanase
MPFDLRVLGACAAAGLAALLGSAVSASATESSAALIARLAAPKGSPVAVNGRLHVCGQKLCNSAGKPVQLRGMSTHGLQWYGDCINDASLDALAGDWKADVLRISLYVQEGGYETDPKGFSALVDDIIEKLSARGLYAIVDWHILDPGDPNFNLERAKRFFARTAKKHRDRPNVLYEVANEPNGVGWETIRSYHEAIIPVIRDRDPQAVILLGTRAWSSFGVSDGSGPSEVIKEPVRADNVMYTFHFYAGSHGAEYLKALENAAAKLPVFVTEFGTQNASGDGENDFASAKGFLDLMAREKISWTNWNYSDDHRSGAVFVAGTCPNGDFAAKSSLKPAGAWVRKQIRAGD